MPADVESWEEHIKFQASVLMMFGAAGKTAHAAVEDCLVRRVLIYGSLGRNPIRKSGCVPSFALG